MNQVVNVFLAEDSRPDVFLVRRALSEHGLEYELTVAEDGDRAAALLDQVGDNTPCPDVALIDLNLPRTDGPELVRLLRDHPKCSGVPVIVITSSDSPKDRAQMADLGVRGYFRKPSDLAEFMMLGSLVRDILRQKPPCESECSI